VKPTRKPAKAIAQPQPSLNEKRRAAKPMDTFTGTPSGEGNEDELSDLDTTWTKAEKVFSENPIIAAVERCLHQRGEVHLATVSVPKINAMLESAEATEQMRAVIRNIFNDEAFREIGTLVIEALLKGDAGFAVVMKKAIREADRVFHRDREKALVDKFAPVVWSYGDKVPPKAELIRRLAQNNNGKAPTPQQWRRIRKALNLEMGETGRPRKPDTKS
jgi:hypothetical protein